MDYIRVHKKWYDVHVNQLLKDRAVLFSKRVSEEIRGAIAAKGYSQRQVAREIKRQPKNLSQWLSGERQIPMDVAYQICGHVGMNIQTIVARAEQDVINEVGPWPPIEINLEALSDEDKKRIVMEKVRQGDMNLAAYHDENKESEREADPDAGA
ncbi:MULTISPECIES: helix-turn-helix domain-containing protein [Bifidobacterium]|uniref:XRE family transcriptional regulator n=1 Tax=Bifidobacterium tibiigranuli TaxID=2172043 RepID=A0A5N6SB91_9BIFI|nr:helix-turn-helix transcriptional regulator [Bifidobacterium tibiigranuli]KAE8130247.1 XRE family transcriptional regulator [Bifidobacterium tibiigranuli]KAE8130394.1 hypothetical protein DDF78_00340 [Bifidobacterium tibiigranuli]